MKTMTVENDKELCTAIENLFQFAGYKDIMVDLETGCISAWNYFEPDFDLALTQRDNHDT